MQDRSVKFLGLQVSQSSDFQVLVGNSGCLNCNSMCLNVPIQLGNTQFFIHFFVLPISGAEVVLGSEWFKTLGPILTDYANLTMKFNRHGHPIILQGITTDNINAVSSSQLKRMHAMNS